MQHHVPVPVSHAKYLRSVWLALLVKVTHCRIHSINGDGCGRWSHNNRYWPIPLIVSSRHNYTFTSYEWPHKLHMIWSHLLAFVFFFLIIKLYEDVYHDLRYTYCRDNIYLYFIYFTRSWEMNKLLLIICSFKVDVTIHSNLYQLGH